MDKRLHLGAFLKDVLVTMTFLLHRGTRRSVLVTVVTGLKWSSLLKTQILGLLVGQSRDLHTNLL